MGYEYRYDSRGRIVYKKLPGCGYIKYWYDKADRMICMQDAVMRSAGKYRFSIYDKLNRLVVQGLCTACQNSTTVQNATFSTSAAGVLGTSYVMPSDFNSALKNAELEIVNYYDGNQNSIYGNKKDCFSSIKLTTSVSQKGMLTGSISSTSNGELIAQVMVYDIKGNLTSAKSSEIGGKIVTNTNKYSFTQKLLSSTTTVNVKYGSNLKIVDKLEYSNYNNAKLKDTITISHGTSVVSGMSYTYDKLGRLTRVTRPTSSSTNRYVDYAYDMHGWLEKISTSTFSEELFYAGGPGNALYNGNISSIRWTDKSGTQKRGYKFSYDAYNRLTAGTYGETDDLSTNVNRFNEKMTYDENGNIKTVVRYGRTGSGSTSYGVMDNLTISYSGNQPTSVSEAAADYNPTGSFEYKKAKGSGYKFNTNGSLIADKSRGIAYITYDYNNNPKQIYFTNGNVTKYVYSASGQKLRAVHYTAVSNITRTWGTKPAELTKAQILYADSTDYLLGGSLTMKNGKIDMFLFDGGYAQASVASSTTDKFAFYYYNKDHLGNNHEVVDAKGVVQQVTNYYPFGAPYADTNASLNPDKQQYKYNGKELDRMHGLNTYDYGARQHDPILGRWDRIDPLCEKYYSTSPYVYCMNNPVRFIDPDGRKVVNSNGIKIYYINANNQLCCSNSASNNEKMVFNGMMLTNIGQKMLRQMIRSQISINMQFKDKCSDDTKNKTTFADTQQYKKGIKNYGITRDKNGKYRTSYSTITFYMNSIEESLNITSSSNYGLTLTEALGAEGTHEAVHASDEEEIHKDLADANGGTHRTEKEFEEKPRKVEQQFRDELAQIKENE